MAADPTRTAHGLEWGNAKVSCLMENHGHRWLEIVTPRETLEIRVTPSGLLRTRTISVGQGRRAAPTEGTNG